MKNREIEENRKWKTPTPLPPSLPRAPPRPLGLPLRQHGTVGDGAAAVMRFTEKLRARLAVAVLMQDERLTRYEAEQMMIERGFARSKRRARSDEFAAMIILQDYLSAAKAEN